MLKISNVSDPYANLKAPSVYIKAVELSDKTVGVNYYLYDTEDTETGQPIWSRNNEILTSLSVKLIYSGSSGVSEHTKSLSQIVKGKDLKFEDNWSFPRRTEDAFSITASCGNDFIIGTTTNEKIYEKDQIVKTYVGDKEYKYINKVINVDLLNAPMVFSGSFMNNNSVISGGLLTSYTTDKKANMCFVFDMESYLMKYSVNYQILSKFKKFRDFVITNSKIDALKSAIYKKEVKTSKGKAIKIDSPFEKIDTSINLYRLSEKEGKFLVSFTDQNTKKSNLEYSVKVNLEINDASETFFDDYIVNRLFIISNIIKSYKNTLEVYSTNKTIDSATDYFFIHDYDVLKTYTTQSGETVRVELYKIFADIATELAEAASVFTEKNVDDLISFYTSVLHPLTTNISLLEGLINFVDTLNGIATRYTKVKNVLQTSVISKTGESINTFEHDFNGLDIDYAYDEAYGYEVFVTDNYASRINYKNSGLRLYTVDDKKARVLSEATKYFASPDQFIRNTLNSYSVSSIDIGNKTFNLSGLVGSIDIATANEIYVYMKAKSEKILRTINNDTTQNSYDYDYGKYGSVIYQLATDGISIENILNSPNQSINGLNKNILFDVNGDSKQLSLQYITNTKILYMYLALDTNTISNIPKDDKTTLQFVAAWNLLQRQNARLSIDDAILKDLSVKTKVIFYYNQIFKEEEISTGTNYSLYSLIEINGNTNNIYAGFRQFNQYYILQKNQEALSSTLKFGTSPVEDMMLNIKPEYLNRSVSEPENNLTVEDI